MNRLLRSLILGSALPAAMILAAGAQPARADAAAAPHLVAPPGTDAQVLNYWTADRLRAAKPMRHLVSGSMHHTMRAQHLSKSATQVFHGALPTVDAGDELATQLFDVTPNEQHAGVKAPLVGSAGLPYTTNRLYPVADHQLVHVFPYATFGQLFFTINGSPYVCTASVIRANVIATAGHCVNDGNGNYYANWLFVPGESGGSAPFGKWTWSNADTTSSWYYGGGVVPNDQDDALIVLNVTNVHGARHRIGDLVGYLGYEFNAPLPTAVTQIGYPCNLDSCADPVATYSQDNSGPTNNFQWGTASFGGASGGPEIQDFGQAPSGVPSETLGGNIVVSSTSYTYTDPNVQADGGSIFYAPGQNGEYTFGDLINWACSLNAC